MKKIVTATVVVLLAGAAWGVGSWVIHPSLQETSIDEPLVTWYALMYEGNQYGYAYERIAPTPSGYDYSIEVVSTGVVELGENRILAFPSSKLDASLDKNFFTRNAKATFDFYGKTSYLDLKSRDDSPNLTLDITLGGRKTKPWTVSKADEFYVTDSVALYAMKQQGVLDREAKRTIRLLTWWDSNSPIQDIEFNFGRQKVQKVYLGQERNVTYVRWKADVKFPGIEGDYPLSYDLYLDGQGRILEQMGLDRVQLIIVPSSAEAKGRGAPFTITQKQRDPFRKDLVLKEPRKSPGVSELGGGRDKQDKPLVKEEDAPRLLNEAGQLLKEMEKLKGNKPELEKKYSRLLDIYKGIRTFLKPGDMLKLRQLKLDAEKFYPGAAMAYQEALAIVTRAAAAKFADNCTEIAKLSDQVMKLSEDLRLAESDLKSKVLDLHPKLQALQEQCQNMKYLKEKKLDVTGVVSYDDLLAYPVNFDLDLLGQKVEFKEAVYVAVPRTYAIVNNQLVRPGNVIEKDIMVKDVLVDPSRVVFAYKNVERPVMLGEQPKKK